MLAVTATAREAEALTDALTSLLPGEGVAYFPAWETLPHERISPGSDTCGRRLAVLRRLVHPDPADPRTGPLSVVVTPIRGLLQPIVGGLGDIAPVSLRAGQAAGLDEVLTSLVEIGYTRTDLVERRGEMAVRGGIVDVFPPTEEHPLRIEFWGDEVEEIRQFRVADQRSLQTADGLWAPPCRELLLTPAVRERAKQLAADHPGLADVLGKLADGIAVEGMEAFAPAIASRMELLLDHVPAGGRVLACDPERIRTRAADLVRTSQEFLAASWVNAAAGGQAPIDLGAAAFRPITQVRAVADRLGLAWWTVTPFESPGAAGGTAAATGPTDTRPARTGHAGTGPAGTGPARQWAMRAASRSASGLSRPKGTGATRPGRSRMCAAGWPTAGGWSLSPRGTDRRSGSPRCCARKGSAPGSVTWTSRPSPACPASRPGSSATASPGSRSGWR